MPARCTTKHYFFLADLIKKIDFNLEKKVNQGGFISLEEVKEEIRQTFIKELEIDNPNFKEELFIKACKR